MERCFSIIVAHTEKLGIGLDNGLPWKSLKKDMKHFRETTIGTIDSEKRNCVIMGRNTWESIPSKYRPLAKRLNLVISSTLKIDTGDTKTFTSLSDALTYSYDNSLVERTFVIGGSQVYNEAIERMDLAKVISTIVKKDYKVDRYFPKYPRWIVKTETIEIDDEMDINIYENVADPNSQEQTYLNCMKRILDNGEKISDRTGVGTLSVFDENLKFSIKTINPDEPDQKKLKYQVPIMTTKNLYLRGVFWELIWFLQGNTDSNWLKDKKVRIWDGNTSKEFLESRGLPYEEGQLGPGYGHQWVNWGGKFGEERKTGINQIKKIIDTLRTNPASRRIVLSAWNVSDLDKMALPPCHMMYIFKVSNHSKSKPTLNCKVILRSNDMFLGNPFNIMSTALLTIFISRAVGMLPGDISISITDAHIYLNHIEQTKEQLSRIPLKAPLLSIDKDIAEYEDMLNLTYKDVQLSNYHKWPTIKAKMAA
jgi:dihydrofolate reductase / thymidylate synthase